MLSEAFWIPNRFVAAGRILRIIFAKQKFAPLRTNYIRRILPAMFAKKTFAQLRTGFRQISLQTCTGTINILILILTSSQYKTIPRPSITCFQQFVSVNTVSVTLRASLSGTFLQTLPDLVTPLKGHTLSPRSCPPTRSAPSERFGY